MLELTSENVLEYLRAKGWIGSAPARVETLGWGVSNLVLRIITPERKFIVKQSRPQLRTRDAWFSDLERIFREQEVMEFLHPFLPDIVPEVLFRDRENYVFAMTHAPDDATVWKVTLLSGLADVDFGRRVGETLGLIHVFALRDERRLKPFRDHTVFVQLRVEPFYYRVQERRPEVAARVQPIIDRMLCEKNGLCHGDYSPKNILKHARGFTLVDYETAHYGDSTMDLGFFLSHLILKAAKHTVRRDVFFELTRAFWDGYALQVGRPLADFEAPGIEHFAVCALARIDGTSPVDYLPEESKREAIRQVGRSVLANRPRRWEDVLSICESYFRPLC